MFKNLKVRSKLLLAFGIVIGLYIIAVIAASVGLKNFYNVPYPMVEASLKAQAATKQIQLDVYRSYETNDDAELQSLLGDIEESTQTLNAAIEDLNNSYEGDASLLQAVKDTLAKTADPRQKALDYIAAQDDANAIAIITGEYTTACNNFNAALQDIIDVAEGNATAFYNSGMSTTQICYILLYILAGVSLILTILLVISITKGLTRPIAEIEHAVKEMANGRMDSEVTYTSKDELGVLAENLRFVLTTLSTYIQHICSRLNSLASGDLTVEMDMEYLGEFASIQESGNKIIDALNDTLGQLHQASEQVASGSEQVSSGAQALSQGATEQASSVQELAATINELSEQVNQTAQNSRDINALISETGQEVENSNHKMETMMSAMTKINESSSQIEKIIKTIEDIAFQTNILALNAAVEAARAGEAGKGFAVVADEVRSLASKSAEAAKNTTVLIGNSLSAVAEGNQIAEDTQSSLVSVVTSTQKISENMAKITNASDMQAEGISQVTTGVDQISSVVQTNSATAEQSAAASEELFGQSTLLKSLVGRFRLKGMPEASAPVQNIAPSAAPHQPESYHYDEGFVEYDNSKY